MEISEKMYTKKEAAPQDVTVLFVMAPIMCRFVLWVLQQAMASGKKRLYFLARDGYSMYQAACIFCEKWNLAIECRYLYCSRYALRSAEYCLLREDSVSYICLGGIDVTFEKMMHRAGLCTDEVQKVAEAICFKNAVNQPLSYDSIKMLALKLRKCSLFVDILVSHSREKYGSVCGYLKQEGLLEKGAYAIVDSGWMGSMQQSLRNLLKSEGYEAEVEGYYFGMYGYPDGVSKENYHAWYFKPEKEIHRKVFFSNSLFECIFSSPEGMTTGYTEANGRFEPSFEKNRNPNRNQIERTTMLLKKYAEMITQNEWSYMMQTGSKAREMAESLFFLFMGKPTVQEAENFGNYIFCDDVIGEEKQTVAAHLSLAEIRENRFLNKGIRLLLRRGKSVRESAWLEGSIMLNGQACLKELKHCAFYKYLLYWRKSMKRGGGLATQKKDKSIHLCDKRIGFKRNQA